MDFNSALANLQRTANAVRNKNDGTSNTSDRRQQANQRWVDGRGRGEGGRGGGAGAGLSGRGASAGGESHYHRREGDDGFDSRRRPREDCRHVHRGGGRGFPPGSDGGGSSRPVQRPRLEDPLEPMRRFGYRVNPYRPSPAPPPLEEGTQASPRCRHICLLALTIDELPYEHIWKTWASKSSDDSLYVSLVCHAKFPSRVRSEWLQRRMLTRKPVLGRGNSFADPEYMSYAPEWGSVELTRAMLATLVQGMRIGKVAETFSSDPRFSPNRHVVRPVLRHNDAGLQDKPPCPAPPPPVDAFIFISETCLPVRSVDECAREIFPRDGVDGGNAESQRLVHSWVAARNRRTPGTPRNKYEVDQFGKIHRMVPGQFRWKADQWMLLSRDHASSILNIDGKLRASDQLWNSFVGVSASDEMYFPTAMGVLGIIRDDAREDQQVLRRQVTYVDWSEGMRNPAAYSNGVRDFARVAKVARESGSLFARKFLPVAPGSDQVTGKISAEEWSREVAKLESIARNESESGDPDGASGSVKADAREGEEPNPPESDEAVQPIQE